jgi:16S rRNA (cytidine1402-2'-O)-methyltransferase
VDTQLESKPAGLLYVVATPIGNLQDLSPRAQAVLATVQQVAAEDTRHSRPLLQHFGISTPLLALHEHNERQATEQLLHRLQQGDNVALISDAGTPLVSDPGARLIQAAHQAGIKVVPIPGPSALITALSGAGFSAERFVFEGFLPPKTAARQRRLSALVQEERTLVFYEAPHRVLDSLADMAMIFGETRPAVLAKELTKIYETLYAATLQDLQNWLSAKPERQKGEFVLVVAGCPPPLSDALDPAATRVLRLLCRELPHKQAVKLAAEITGLPKNQLYTQALAWSNSDEEAEA